MPARRQALQALLTAGTVGLAGCGLTGTSTPDPDRGTDSYGLDVRNNTNYRQRVTVRVEAIEPDTAETSEVFRERIALAGGERRRWDGVLTQDIEYIVRASVGDGDAEYEQAMRRITVGREFSPDVADVTVTLHSITLRREVRRTTAVRIGPRADAG